MTMRQVYQITLDCSKAIQDVSYNLKTIWEYERKRQKETHPQITAAIGGASRTA